MQIIHGKFGRQYNDDFAFAEDGGDAWMEVRRNVGRPIGNIWIPIDIAIVNEIIILMREPDEERA